MAESRRSRYNLGDQLDIEQILLEAQNRWLRPPEICEILQNYRKFSIAPEPPTKPPSGSLFLFDRKVLRYFRKDGHNWRKKKDGKTVKEAHERLKSGSVDVLHCYYAHGEGNESFQRRCYWMLEEAFMHIVLVHYREVKGGKTSFGFPLNSEAIPSSRMGSPASSGSVSNHNHMTSSADTTSFNSFQTSEYEDAESESQQTNATYHSYVELLQSESKPLVMQTDAGVLSDFFSVSNPGTQCNFHGGESVSSGPNLVQIAQENGYASVRPLYSSTAASAKVIPQQRTSTIGQRFSGELHGKHEDDREDKWKINSEDAASHISAWSMEQKLRTDSGCDPSNRFNEQNAHYSTADLFSTNLERKNENQFQRDFQVHISDAEVGGLMKSYLESDMAIDGNNYPFSATKRLESSRSDSFNRWMSKELGEVDESHTKSSSRFSWITVQSESVVDDASISPQQNLDAYLLSPSLSQDQLFSIIDFSPNWAYTTSETKVLITGTFLKNHQDVAKSKWSCMFGAVEVPAEVLGNSVLRCHAPLHTAGRVPFYVTCSNRSACSEVREFEFRVDHTRDFDMNGLYGGRTSDMLLHVRLGKLLSLGSVSHQSLSNNSSEKPYMSSQISSFMKDDDDDDWFQMIKVTSEEEFSPGKVKEQLLQKMLKEKLREWVVHKITGEDDKGPSTLDKEGQGVLHLAAALGYDWAIEPTVASGVSINFRDANGWTALHWAAFCGRERTVGALVSLEAAPGVLTDPTPEFPTGRTPADLASANGHKGIAGYLAECSLTTHLSTLTLKDKRDNDLDVAGVKAVQTISERSATPVDSADAPDVSLKDSLTAVCNATQAAARIHQVFRVQSFHHKQLIENGDGKSRMSDEKALSLISIKKKKHGQNDDPVHTAAVRIQNKFRGWKGRKDFLVVRQKIVHIQAHVRGHQVRKKYSPIIWSVGIVEKVILRWRRKGCGLRGFRSEPLIPAPNTSSTPKEDDYDFLKKGKKQTEERLQKALARVKSMVQYPEARDQYRRLLNVVSEFQEAKVMCENSSSSNSGEADDVDDDLVNLQALLDDDTFMPTAW